MNNVFSTISNAYTIESFYPVIIIGTITLIMFIILYAVVRNQETKSKREIKQRIDAVRIFILDFNNNEVVFFNRNTIGKKKKGTLDLFFEQIHPDEIERVRNWVLDLLDPNERGVAPYIEADVIVKSEAKSFFSLFQLIHVNKETRKIYLESYLLRLLKPRLRLPRRGRHQLVSEIRAQQLFDRYRSRNRGTTSVIRLFKVGKVGDKDEKHERLIMSFLLDKLMMYLGTNRYAMQLSNHEVAIFDYKYNSKQESERLAHSILIELDRFLAVSGLVNKYSFSIGMIENKEINASYEITLTSARESAILAQEGGARFKIYDKTPELDKDRVLKQLKSESLTNLIKNRNIKITFRPIVNAKRAKTIGYLTDIQPTNSLFNNFREMKDYAAKSNQIRELFALIAKESLAKFYNQRDDENLLLFLPVGLADQPAILRTLPNIPYAKDVKTILVLDESDPAFLRFTSDDIYNIVSELNDANIDISLVISDEDLTLEKRVYEQIDWFIVDERLTKNIHADDRMRLRLASTLEKLIKYKKHIIISDLNSWTAIEFILKTGMIYVSSEEISQSSEMVLPVDKKKLERTRKLIDYN